MAERPPGGVDDAHLPRQLQLADRHLAERDIFRQNALKNGLLPVELPERAHAEVLALVAAHPGVRVRVDLDRLVVSWPSGECAFTIDAFARTCLLNGVDEIGYVLRQEGAIAEYERRLGA